MGGGTCVWVSRAVGGAGGWVGGVEGVAVGDGWSGSSGTVWFYLLVMFVATLPWSVSLGMGLVEGVKRFRGDLRARIILLLIGCMIIPMSMVGKKQDHYFMAAMPGLMAAAGWSMERVL